MSPKGLIRLIRPIRQIGRICFKYRVFLETPQNQFLPLGVSPGRKICYYGCMLLKELLVEYLEHLELEKNMSQGTIKMYHFYLSDFLLFISRDTGHDATEKDLTEEVVKKYRLGLNRRISHKSKLEYKRTTQKVYLVALRSFIKWLILSKGYNIISPDKIELGRSEAQVPKFLSRSEVTELLSLQNPNKKSGLRDKAMMELLFSTGMRVSELVGLNKDDFTQAVLDRGEFSVIGKGRKVRTVYISDTAKQSLKAYLAVRTEEFEPLFLRYSGRAMDKDDTAGLSLRLTVRSVERLIKRYALKAGIRQDVSPHTLRHSYATDLLIAGADLRSVQELLGHSNVATTQIYTHVTNKQLKDVHLKFHGKS